MLTEPSQIKNNYFALRYTFEATKNLVLLLNQIRCLEGGRSQGSITVSPIQEKL